MDADRTTLVRGIHIFGTDLSWDDTHYESKIHDKVTFYWEVISNTGNIGKSSRNRCAIIPRIANNTALQKNNFEIHNWWVSSFSMIFGHWIRIWHQICPITSRFCCMWGDNFLKTKRKWKKYFLETMVS